MSVEQKTDYLNHLKLWIAAWAPVTLEELQFDRLTGITNVTYKISYTGTDASVQPRELIGRAFGKSVEDIFIVRDYELKIYQMCAKNNLGPQIYGYADSFRAEEYIHSDVLQHDQMREPAFYRPIAVKLAQFHKQSLPEIGNSTLIERLIHRELPIIDKVLEKSAQLELFTEPERLVIQEVLGLLSAENQQFLLQQLEKYPHSRVFAHNDALANNILIDHVKKEPFFIDFEYSCPNLRSFDIGNFMVETQFNYDVKEDPYFTVEAGEVDVAVVHDMLRYYAAQFLSDKVLRAEDIDPAHPTPQEQALFEELSREVYLSMALSNFYWSVWGIFMSKNPDIQFDYVKFTHARYQKFLLVRNKYLV